MLPTDKTTKSSLVYIYSPYWHNMGGGERYLLHLSKALSNFSDTNVTLLSTSPSISKQTLHTFFELDLTGINYHVVENKVSALRKVTEKADLFLPLSNYKRIDAKPRQYVQAFQVPYPKINAKTISRRILGLEIKEGIKDIYRFKLLSKTKRHSTLTLTNSQFVHDTLLKNFGIRSKVLYPPINDFNDPTISKGQSILSVGRIFRGLYNEKRYDVLTKAFRELYPMIPGWEYHIVGSISSDRKSAAHLEELKESNRGYPVFFHINVTNEQLKSFYNNATIYWHGAGFGVDEEQQPEATEHFGMSVVESMTAGCIPVIVNKGGLKEIVSSDVDGFLWETTNDLAEQTLHIVRVDEGERRSLAIEARKKSRKFSVESFDKRVVELFTPLLR